MKISSVKNALVATIGDGDGESIRAGVFCFNVLETFVEIFKDGSGESIGV